MNGQQSILDAGDIERIITRITHELLEDNRGTENLVLIGIQTRGVFLAKRIGKKNTFILLFLEEALRVLIKLCKKDI